MNPAGIHPIPPLVAALVTLGAVLLVVGAVWLVIRKVRRQPEWLAANIRGLWVFLVALVGGLVGYSLWSGDWTLMLAATLNLATFLLLMLGYFWVRRRGSLFRAIRRMNAGDHAGAVAELRARIDRQRLALGGAPSVGTSSDQAASGGDFNPYAAPSVSTPTPGDWIRLVQDLNTLGVVEENRGHWADALLAYDEAIALGGDGAIGPILRGNRAYALIELGRTDEGLPLLRAAIAELAPADRWSRAQFLTALADKLLGLGQPAEVGALLDRARREGQREKVYPRSGKQVWLARLDSLQTRLATAEAKPAARGDPA